MNEGIGIVIQLLLLGVVGAMLFLLTWRRQMHNLKTWLATHTTRLRTAYAAYQQEPRNILPYDTSVLLGAAYALAHPPARLYDAIDYISGDTGFNYDLILGWKWTGVKAHCLSAPLVGDVYHTLITGQSRAGKDNLALNAMIGLALVYPPEKVQCCIIDGKGLDFVGFEGKSHTWHLALKPSEIAGALEALSAERERRGDILRKAKVSKWEAYTGPDMPLLVVYVSELSLLEGAVGKRYLTDWLNQELAAGAAFGLRYVIATQTASNFDTRWRSQISLYLAAFQPSQSQDQPNTGLMTKELRDFGGVPPSELPAPPVGAGVFTCVQGRKAVTIRAGLMDDQQRHTLLDQLPSAPGTVSVSSVLSDTNAPCTQEQQHPSEPLNVHEEIRKLAAAGMSRNKIARRLGGQRAKTLATIRDALDEK